MWEYNYLNVYACLCMVKNGLLAGKYVVAIIIGPRLVSLSTTRKSISKSSYDLCLIIYFIAMAEPSDGFSVT